MLRVGVILSSCAGQEARSSPFWVLTPYRAGEERLDGPRWRAHDNLPRPPHGSNWLRDGGISFLASCAVLGAIILLPLPPLRATGCAPGP